MLTKDRATAIVGALLVWSLAGAMFGALFLGIYEVLRVLGLAGWRPLVFGAAAAAMTTSAFYSAMPIALVGATAGIVASIVYLMTAGHLIQLSAITLVAAGVGVAAGAFYSWIMHRGSRALAETLTGMLAGIGAGLVLSLLLALSPVPIDSFVLAAGVVALVGTLFQLNEHWIVQACQGLVPDSLAAPVVGGLIAAVVGAGVWIMTGSGGAALDLETRNTIDRVLSEVPWGLLGGMLGGAVTGLLLELLGFHLEDRATSE